MLNLSSKWTKGAKKIVRAINAGKKCGFLSVNYCNNKAQKKIDGPEMGRVGMNTFPLKNEMKK